MDSGGPACRRVSRAKSQSAAGAVPRRQALRRRTLDRVGQVDPDVTVDQEDATPGRRRYPVPQSRRIARPQRTTAGRKGPSPLRRRWRPGVWTWSRCSLSTAPAFSRFRLEDVLLTWDRALIQFFLDGGADPVTGNPFLIAFQNRVQRCAPSFSSTTRRLTPSSPMRSRSKPNRALRHFAYQADLKWISLLMWAGANPRSGACQAL